VRDHRLSKPAISQRTATTTHQMARARARLDGNNTRVQTTHKIARAPARAQTKAAPPTKTHEIARAQTTRAPTTTHKIERTCARTLTIALNGISETEGAHLVRQHSTKVLCTHWASSTYRAASVDAVGRLALASGNEQRGGGWGVGGWGWGVGARGDAQQNQGTGNDNTKRGRGGSKKEKKLESYFSKKNTRSCGERCLNTDTTGRHQQRWRGPETRSHRTAVVGTRVCTLHKDR
jgi:hypothetical protein